MTELLVETGQLFSPSTPGSHAGRVLGNVLVGVKVLGLASRNGRCYPKATIEKAAALYEGAKVNIDHPVGDPSSPRRYGDRIGTLQKVRVRPDGLYADLAINPKHALAGQLLWDAEHCPGAVGLSHNILAKTGRSGGQVVVEEITAVQSVDLVADPATTSGLFESVGPLSKAALIETSQQAADFLHECLRTVPSAELRTFATNLKR